MEGFMVYYGCAIWAIHSISFLKHCTVYIMTKYKRIPKEIKKIKFWNIFVPKILENDLRRPETVAAEAWMK